MRPAAASLLLALALVPPVACRRSEPLAAPGEPARGSGATSIPQGGAAPELTVVDVMLGDRGLVVAGSLPPGRVLLRVHNEGTKPHSLALDGAGGKLTLEDPVEPGELGELRAELVGGTYSLRCPLRGHGELPRMLVVTDRATAP